VEPDWRYETTAPPLYGDRKSQKTRPAFSPPSPVSAAGHHAPRPSDVLEARSRRSAVTSSYRPGLTRACTKASARGKLGAPRQSSTTKERAHGHGSRTAQASGGEIRVA